MELVLHVTRDEHSRLTGSVRATTEPGAREFSGVLELLRVFEELVPDDRDRGARDGAEPRTTEERSWTNETSTDGTS